MKRNEKVMVDTNNHYPWRSGPTLTGSGVGGPAVVRRCRGGSASPVTNLISWAHGDRASLHYYYIITVYYCVHAQ